MRILNKNEFLKLIDLEELKHLEFYESERAAELGNNNFRVISGDKKTDLPSVKASFENFCTDYAGQTFICKASRFKNKKNVKNIGVRLADEVAAVNGSIQQDDKGENELTELRKKLASYENRDESRKNVLDLLINTIFDKFADNIENLVVNNLNILNQTPMNGEVAQENTENNFNEIESALMSIAEVLGNELTISVAKKLKESPVKYKMLIKNFL